MILWRIRFNSETHGWLVVPAVTVLLKSRQRAIMKAKRLIPFAEGVQNTTASPLNNNYVGELVFELQNAFNEFCNCSVGKDSFSDDDFDAGIVHYYETGKVLWKLNRRRDNDLESAV